MARPVVRFYCSGIGTLLVLTVSAWVDTARTSDLVSTGEKPPSLTDAIERAVLGQVNEISTRRRLTTFFANEQTPFYGVQLNYVNVGRGNLTFVNRDLVRLDRLPIVFGRVYDSKGVLDGDFGPGWKLSVTEVVERRGSGLWYVDASGVEYELIADDSRILSPYPHLTGIDGGHIGENGIQLKVGALTKRFRRIRDSYYLEEVRDAEGRGLSLAYAGLRVIRVSSTGGREVEIARDDSGRITAARDDAGRTVRYAYDALGRLSVFTDVGGGTWLMTYDDGGRLTGVLDPQQNSALKASFDDQNRATQVEVLYDRMSFMYERAQTVVRTALQQSATFWQAPSGLTYSAQDFAGDFTEIVFNDSLQPVALSFNGTMLALLRYQQGLLRGVRSFVDGAPSTSVYTYDDAGRLEGVQTDGQVSAQYVYDELGRVSSVLDWSGYREYSYRRRGQIEKVTINGVDLALRSNDFGLLTAFSGDDFRVGVTYDERDQIRQLSYRLGERRYDSRYMYGRLGLRAHGSYVPDLEPEKRISLEYSYDGVGNLIGLDQEGPGPGGGWQRYSLGENNELLRVASSGTAELEFEYDASGRPSRATFGEQETVYEYDVLGRLSDVHLNGDHVLTSNYGPMHVDPATEADGHTPMTTVATPIASPIFGSIDAIAYTRSKGAPFGPIRFVSTMARFVLAEALVPAPDAALLASFKRRALPFAKAETDGYGDVEWAVNPGPMGFDKPANGLFLPAEFSSLNCYLCMADTTPSPAVIYAAADMDVSFPGSHIEVGEAVQFIVDAVGSQTCRMGVMTYADPEDVTWYTNSFTHYVYFGNGQNTYESAIFDDQFSRVYSSPGNYTVEDYVVCGEPCPWVVYVAELEEEIVTCSGAEFDSTRSRFTGPRPSNIQSRYEFQDQGNVFRFEMQPWSGSIAQSSISAGFAIWNNVIDTQSCGAYDIDADMIWGSATSRDIVFEVVAELPGSCGNFDPQGAGGLDLIEIPETLGGTCGPVPEILGHEVGHAIGFGNAANTNATDIMNSPRQGPGTVKDYHAQTLLFYY